MAEESTGAALYHFIDGDGDQHPAVPASLLREWLAEGYVNETTYVWADDGSLATWVELWQATALYEYCTVQQQPATQEPTIQRQPSEPGKPPVFFIHDADVAAAAKYEKKRKVAKGVAVLSALLLISLAGATLFLGPSFWDTFLSPWASSSCDCRVADTALLRVAHAWMFLFALLLLAAELGSPIIRTYVHFLAYRTGRAGVGFFCATVLISAALCPSYDESGDPGKVNSSAPVGAPDCALAWLPVGRVQWKMVFVAVAVLASATFNLLVTKRGKKIGRSRMKAKPALL